MAGRYPLSALLELREAVRSGCEAQLAAAIGTEQQQQQQLAVAETELAGAIQRVRERREAALSDGAATRLAEQQRYVRRLETAAREAGERREAAARALEQARELTALARRALSSAEADVELVERNRARWNEARRAQEMRRAEAELEDIVAARHRGTDKP